MENLIYFTLERFSSTISIKKPFKIKVSSLLDVYVGDYSNYPSEDNASPRYRKLRIGENTTTLVSLSSTAK